MIETVTVGEAATAAVGESLAARLKPGDVIFLFGGLGAGKTAFVRGVAGALGANTEEVSSPTFTIIQEYAASAVTLYHVDLYRLEPAEIEDLGLDDVIAGAGVVAIEWADRWPGRPRSAVEVTIDVISENERRVSIALQDPQKA